MERRSKNGTPFQKRWIQDGFKMGYRYTYIYFIGYTYTHTYIYTYITHMKLASLPVSCLYLYLYLYLWNNRTSVQLDARPPERTVQI